MKKYFQKEYEDEAYGNGSIAENGCACCVMASLTGDTPEDIAHRWGNSYWDDSKGTLPQAFDSAERDFGLALKRAPKQIDFHLGDAYVLLIEDKGERHYEILHIVSSGIAIYDPRISGITYCMPSDARCMIESSESAWLTSGIE